jgi:hypothetical protein
MDSNEEGWGPKINHRKFFCPVPKGTYVRLSYQKANGTYKILEGPVTSEDPARWVNVAWYQVRQFRAMAELKRLASHPLDQPLIAA